MQASDDDGGTGAPAPPKDNSYLNKLRLDGRAALIIGAGGGGMGTATSLALAEAGATIVAVDLDADRVRETAEKVEARGGTCLAFTADARDASAVGAVIQQAWDELGAVHHLVNVIGGSQRNHWIRTEELAEDVFDEIIAFNLRTHFISCREVARRMIAHGIAGSIVNYSSISGTFSQPYQVGYSAAKAAVNGLTRTMAVEWGPHGIRVNAVAPGGGIFTPRFKQAQQRPDGAVYNPGETNPLGRGLEPEEIAATVLFLVSDLASAITGQTVGVDAGLSVRSAGMGLEEFAKYLAPA
jgi:NAD(P)-dependent dehydrogenase (short-subunit alcohol dehydrogenase family)